MVFGSKRSMSYGHKNEGLHVGYTVVLIHTRWNGGALVWFGRPKKDGPVRKYWVKEETNGPIYN